jgi:hypothetical protein
MTTQHRLVRSGLVLLVVVVILRVVVASEVS